MRLGPTVRLDGHCDCDVHVGVRTIVTVTLLLAGTVPTLHNKIPFCGVAHAPPGVAVAELNVKPWPAEVPVRVPAKATLFAFSCPSLTQVNVNVTWDPIFAGFGLADGVLFVYEKWLCEVISETKAFVPFDPCNGFLLGKFPDCVSPAT